jgi:dTDP-4-dehydrorhamnose 3,5-epimerase
LSAANRTALYIPPGVAHGYQTLSDGAEASYQMSAFYAPECAAGVRCNDPALGIRWPLEISVLSERDRALPLLSEFSGEEVRFVFATIG